MGASSQTYATTSLNQTYQSVKTNCILLRPVLLKLFNIGYWQRILCHSMHQSCIFNKTKIDISKYFLPIKHVYMGPMSVFGWQLSTQSCESLIRVPEIALRMKILSTV